MMSIMQIIIAKKTLHIIEDELKDIDMKHEILYHLTGQETEKRKRRGLINGVSYALNWLFGTPDADDAKYYTDSINMLLDDNKQTQTLMKSQIQIISSKIRNFNQSLASLKATENILNENSNRINKYLNQTKVVVTKVLLQSMLEQHITTLLALTNRISREYNKYIEAINLGRHNILSPLIVTPKVLLKELITYKGEQDLVVSPNFKTLPIFYQILNLQLIFSENIIVFVLNIPLVQKTVFDLYQLIPLPLQFQNTSYFSYIIPTEPYLIMSQPKTHFSYLHDLLSCIAYLDGKYVCMDVHTKESSEEATCEVQLLSPHISKIPSYCNTKTIRASIEIWTYIQNNQWIYVLQKPTTLTIICKGKEDYMEDIVLHQTGILHLESQCKGYSNFYSLEPTKQTKRNVTYYVPSISIVDSDCCIISMEKVKIDSVQLEPVRLTNVDLSDFKYANKKLSEFDEILTNRLKEPFIVTHTNWYTIVLGLISAILIIVISINCCRWCGCLRLFRRLFCFTRNPNDGQIVPPIIKNFVNCNFNSDIRSEYCETSRDVVTYDSRRETARIHRDTSSDRQGGSEGSQSSTPPLSRTVPVGHYFRTNSRKSTTPI